MSLRSARIPDCCRDQYSNQELRLKNFAMASKGTGCYEKEKGKKESENCAVKFLEPTSLHSEMKLLVSLSLC